MLLYKKFGHKYEGLRKLSHIILKCIHWHFHVPGQIIWFIRDNLLKKWKITVTVVTIGAFEDTNPLGSLSVPHRANLALNTIIFYRVPRPSPDRHLIYTLTSRYRSYTCIWKARNFNGFASSLFPRKNCFVHKIEFPRKCVSKSTIYFYKTKLVDYL